MAAQLRRLYWFVFRPRTRGVKCLIEHEGRWLMIRNTYGRAHWTFVGGGIDRGEEPRDAAIREVFEEVGIELSDARQIGTYFTTFDFKKDTVYCFAATVDSPDFKIDRGEIAEAGWFSPDDLPSFRGPSVAKIASMLEAERNA